MEGTACKVRYIVDRKGYPEVYLHDNWEEVEFYRTFIWDCCTKRDLTYSKTFE